MKQTYKRYILSVVSKASALEEIYQLLSDEMALTMEDLESCCDALKEMSDFNLADHPTFCGNLNFASSQDTLSQRIEVLDEKQNILLDLMNFCRNYVITDLGKVDSELPPF